MNSPREIESLSHEVNSAVMRQEQTLLEEVAHGAFSGGK
jgi:hypothetical protein